MNLICKYICIRSNLESHLDIPDVANDEVGGRNEKVVHPVEAPADWLCVNSVVGHSSTGLIDHLVKSNGEEGGCVNMNLMNTLSAAGFCLFKPSF